MSDKRKRRRFNSHGSVYKCDGRRKPWKAVITVGFDDEGRQQRKVIGYFLTEKEANRACLDCIDNPNMFIDVPSDENLITYNGKALTYRHFLDLHYEVIDALGIERLSPHKLRKTGATLYKSAGVNPNDLQKIIGHSDYSTTAKFYIGSDTGALQNAVDLLE